MHGSGTNSLAVGLSPYTFPCKSPLYQASLNEGFSRKCAWLVAVTKFSQIISTRLLTWLIDGAIYMLYEV